MADRYTDREAALVTILTANLAATYAVSNKDSINLGAGTCIYNVSVNWIGFNNDLDAGTTCFESDREQYRLVCTPLATTDDNASTQCNKMTAEVTAILRNSTLVKASTIDDGETLTEFRVESGAKGYYQDMLSVIIIFSFLADE